jgi:2'-5' RNA ligase
MRAFLAISIPDEVKKLAQQTRDKLASSGIDVKWVEYENYHLTVKFLGNISVTQIKEITNKMQIVQDICPSFKLKVTGLGFFPNRFRPRVIWLGMAGEIDKAVFLGNRVDNYLYEVGFEPEKQHRFHLTLGRLRSEKAIEKMQTVCASLQFKPVTFQVDQFHLMESTLTPAGPLYKTVNSFVLNG